MSNPECSQSDRLELFAIVAKTIQDKISPILHDFNTARDRDLSALAAENRRQLDDAHSDRVRAISTILSFARENQKAALDELRDLGYDPPGDLRTTDDMELFAHELDIDFGTVLDGHWTAHDLYKRAKGRARRVRRESAIVSEHHRTGAMGRAVAEHEGAAAPKKQARKTANRKARTPEITDKQRDPLALADDGHTFTEIGKNLGISRQAATDRVKRGRKNRAAIKAKTAEILAERSSGKSVKPDQNLPHDKRGQAQVESPEPDDD